MQTLKEDVNRRILSAALNEFEQQGYAQSSMRRIAAEAGVTAGNIYRYYKGKEELFQALIRPTYLQFMDLVRLIQTEVDRVFASAGGFPEQMELVDDTFDRLITLLEESSKETKILLTLSQGSAFEHAKQELTDIIAQIFKRVMTRREGDSGPSATNAATAVTILAATIVEGVCITLQNVEEREQIRYSVLELAAVFSAGLKDKAKR
ncbi:TetR/AcrR family transcriptional regulator [Cohnella xylanilytica]|uniref:TetR/AcrR family transcriptional regulator n=1 Tax=Cohnella xylanilytica TaxID=557555 RepID=A0A841UAC8_9BACL|nr:TetR/AcrR family transcriptional regulator [Cohnella xylanilytica]MBB6694880.1 TetR/AcrR family transcriptional regulator [Cohnella xylanilytica]